MAEATYGALTLGVNIEPPVPKAIEGLPIRPEVRFDDSLNGTKHFKAGTTINIRVRKLAFGIDAVIPF